MTRLKTIFSSDDNVEYEVNPAGDLWSYILILRVLYALASVLQSDWTPDFRIRVRKVIRKHTRPFPAHPVMSVPKMAEHGLGWLRQTTPNPNASIGRSCIGPKLPVPELP